MRIRLNKVRYPLDCNRILRILTELGYIATLRDAEDVWRDLSSDKGCTWRVLPESNKELQETLEAYIVEMWY